MAHQLPRDIALNTRLYGYRIGNGERRTEKLMIRVRRGKVVNNKSTGTLALLNADKTNAGREFSKEELELAQAQPQDCMLVIGLLLPQDTVRDHKAFKKPPPNSKLSDLGSQGLITYHRYNRGGSLCCRKEEDGLCDIVPLPSTNGGKDSDISPRIVYYPEWIDDRPVARHYDRLVNWKRNIIEFLLEKADERAGDGGTPIAEASSQPDLNRAAAPEFTDALRGIGNPGARELDRSELDRSIPDRSAPDPVRVEHAGRVAERALGKRKRHVADEAYHDPLSRLFTRPENFIWEEAGDHDVTAAMVAAADVLEHLKSRVPAFSNPFITPPLKVISRLARGIQAMQADGSSVPAEHRLPMLAYYCSHWQSSAGFEMAARTAETKAMLVTAAAEARMPTPLQQQPLLSDMALPDGDLGRAVLKYTAEVLMNVTSSMNVPPEDDPQLVGNEEMAQPLLLPGMAPDGTFGRALVKFTGELLMKVASKMKASLAADSQAISGGEMVRDVNPALGNMGSKGEGGGSKNMAESGKSGIRRV